MLKRPSVLLFVVVALWNAASALADPYGEKIEFVSEQRDGTKETVYGFLSLPEGATARVPALVLVHGSGGLGQRVARYVREFNKMGIATFALDSFHPRGVSTTVADQARVTGAMMMSDAYGALKLLQENPKIDKNRIGIIGWSKGGTTTLDSSFELTARLRHLPEDVRFAVHIPMYPGCTAHLRKPTTRGAPILMLLGAKDNYTGAEPCQRYAEAIKQANGKIDVIVYPNAEHGWDDLDNPPHVWIGGAQNYSKCLIYVEDDGRFTYPKTGQVIDNNLKAYEVLSKDCVTRGASVGQNDAATQKSMVDIQEFLHRTLLKQ